MYTVPKTEFGPRLGFAYRLGAGSRPMVLRGGYRISHFTIPLRTWTAGERFERTVFCSLVEQQR